MRQVNVTHLQNINVTNINVTKVHFVNRSTPGALTVVSRDVFIEAHPVHKSVVKVDPPAVTRAAIVGTTAPVAPSRVSVFARPPEEVARAPKPPRALLERPVVVRATPPPPARFAPSRVVEHEALREGLPRTAKPRPLVTLSEVQGAKRGPEARRMEGAPARSVRGPEGKQDAREPAREEKHPREAVGERQRTAPEAQPAEVRKKPEEPVRTPPSALERPKAAEEREAKHPREGPGPERRRPPPVQETPPPAARDEIGGRKERALREPPARSPEEGVKPRGHRAPGFEEGLTGARRGSPGEAETARPAAFL